MTDLIDKQPKTISEILKRWGMEKYYANQAEQDLEQLILWVIGQEQLKTIEYQRYGELKIRTGKRWSKGYKVRNLLRAEQTNRLNQVLDKDTK